MSESVRLAPRVFIDAMDDIFVEASLLMKKRGLRLCDVRDRMRVSDKRANAISRYLRGRARYGCALLGITVAEAGATICPERLHDGILQGARAIMAANGICYPIKGRVVTTCLTKGMRRARTMHA